MWDIHCTGLRGEVLGFESKSDESLAQWIPITHWFCESRI